MIEVINYYFIIIIVKNSIQIVSTYNKVQVSTGLDCYNFIHRQNKVLGSRVASNRGSERTLKAPRAMAYQINQSLDPERLKYVSLIQTSITLYFFTFISLYLTAISLSK